jgi:hypothetical protein
MSMDEVRYQVFVSSTFIDLKVEREKVLQAILEQRAFPAGMELFPSADEEQFDFIKREIDSSDYYILIIAGRYGSVAEDGISFTEKEYDYAVSKGKPVLSFLHHDIQKLIGEKLESSDEGKGKLDAFRAKARKSRLISHYQNPDDLKSKVLTSLASQFNLKPMRGWVRAGQVSRDSLEEIASLQREVLRLKSEIERLASLGEQPETVLAHGSDVISWDLDFNQFTFDNKWPTQRSYRLETTWDQLLVAVFSKGSSQATTDEVMRRLAKFVLESCPPEVGPNEWRQAGLEVIRNWPTMPRLQPITVIAEDILRQFNGLGLVREDKETIYVPIPYSQSTSAETTDVWRLTEKGQQRLALAQGYRRA